MVLGAPHTQHSLLKLTNSINLFENENVFLKLPLCVAFGITIPLVQHQNHNFRFKTNEKDGLLFFNIVLTGNKANITDSMEMWNSKTNTRII